MRLERCAWLALTATWAQLAAMQLVNGTSDDAKEGALLGLLELVGPVDVANDLHTLGALAPVLEQLREGSGRLRALAAHVVGTAAANNPHVQAQVVALGGVDLLLGAFALDCYLWCSSLIPTPHRVRRACCARRV